MKWHAVDEFGTETYHLYAGRKRVLILSYYEDGECFVYLECLEVDPTRIAESLELCFRTRTLEAAKRRAVRELRKRIAKLTKLAERLPNV